MRQIVNGSSEISQYLLEQRIAQLEQRVAELTEAVRALTAAAAGPVARPAPERPVPCGTAARPQPRPSKEM